MHVYIIRLLRWPELTSLIDNINIELDKICDWLAVNKLSLNASKSNYMIFHHRQKKLKSTSIPILEMNHTLIKQVNEFSFLGLFRLSMEPVLERFRRRLCLCVFRAEHALLLKKNASTMNIAHVSMAQIAAPINVRADKVCYPTR